MSDNINTCINCGNDYELSTLKVTKSLGTHAITIEAGYCEGFQNCYDTAIDYIAGIVDNFRYDEFKKPIPEEERETVDYTKA